MTRYRVRVMPVAKQGILEYAAYIEQRSGSREVAERWVRNVYQATATLEYLPRRYGLAEEDAMRAYEIRRQVIGNYLALYNVDDDSRTVCIVGFRHGSRLPRQDEFPES